MNIKEALESLDPTNDEQWTSDGLPRMGVVEGLVGDRDITRKMVTETDPLFTRETAVVADLGLAHDKVEPEVEVEPEPKVEPEVEVVEEPKADHTEEILALESAKASLEQTLAKAKQAQKDGKKDILKIESEINVCVAKLVVLDPPMTSQQGIQHYIKSSNAARMRRHQAHETALKGIKGDQTTVKAPIDQAFERRNRRGGSRPVGK